MIWKKACTIDLFRHGETEGGARLRGSHDDPLTKQGWTQMWQAVERRQWDRIITSPLIRCADFARALAQQRSIKIETDIRLKEMHFGEWEGLSTAELMKINPEALMRFWRNPARYTPPGAECLRDFTKRIQAAWHAIIAKQTGESILVVTHGGVIRVVLGELMRCTNEKLLTIEVELAAMRRVDVYRSGSTIRATLAHSFA